MYPARICTANMHDPTISTAHTNAILQRVLLSLAGIKKLLQRKFIISISRPFNWTFSSIISHQGTRKPPVRQITQQLSVKVNLHKEHQTSVCNIWKLCIPHSNFHSKMQSNSRCACDMCALWLPSFEMKLQMARNEWRIPASITCELVKNYVEEELSRYVQQHWAMFQKKQ